jgi:maleate cis-trans isomerase
MNHYRRPAPARQYDLRLTIGAARCGDVDSSYTVPARHDPSSLPDHMKPLIEPWFRLAYITPHPIVDNVPYQFYRFAPDGVMLMLANLEIADYAISAVEDQLPLFWKHVTELAHAGADRIVLTGVPVSAALGRERVRSLQEEVKQRTGVTLDTDLEAIAAATRHLGANRVALATRWHEPLNDAVTRYLAQCGIEVVGRQARGATMAQNAELKAADGMQLAIELGRKALLAAPTAQALILPGGRWLSTHAVAPLEEAFGKPVLLNLNCSLWAALHAAGRGLPVHGQGRVLAQR